jgi:hypothetical protein
MSKSYKKHPIVKDKKPKDNFYNKVFRRTNKVLLNMDKELKLQDELVNQYDISDYRFIIDENDNNYNKYLRK